MTVTFVNAMAEGVCVAGRAASGDQRDGKGKGVSRHVRSLPSEVRWGRVTGQALGHQLSMLPIRSANQFRTPVKRCSGVSSLSKRVGTPIPTR